MGGSLHAHEWDSHAPCHAPRPGPTLTLLSSSADSACNRHTQAGIYTQAGIHTQAGIKPRQAGSSLKALRACVTHAAHCWKATFAACWRRYMRDTQAALVPPFVWQSLHHPLHLISSGSKLQVRQQPPPATGCCSVSPGGVPQVISGTVFDSAQEVDMGKPGPAAAARIAGCPRMSDSLAE